MSLVHWKIGLPMRNYLVYLLFAMYFQCICYVFWGIENWGCSALEWKGETDRVYVIPELLRLVSWSFETWTGHVCPVSPPAYPDLCGLSRHNVGFHIFYPPLNIPRLCYRNFEYSCLVLKTKLPRKGGGWEFFLSCYFVKLWTNVLNLVSPFSNIPNHSLTP